MGTWSLPQTLQQAEQLRSLLQQPLSASNALDLLYPLLGDDDLFDAIGRTTKQDGPMTDVRPLVKTYLANFLAHRTEAYQPWEPEAYRLLSDECAGLNPLLQLDSPDR